MNAIKFLLKEHNKVRREFSDIEDDSHKYETKKNMFDTLCNDLIRHEKMEQKLWYPHFKNNEKIDATVKHLISEEKKAETAIKEFDSVKTQKEWEDKFLKLKKDVEHHAAEEEQNLFPKIEKILTEDELEKIGKEMEDFKNEYKS